MSLTSRDDLNTLRFLIQLVAIPVKTTTSLCILRQFFTTSLCDFCCLWNLCNLNLIVWVQLLCNLTCALTLLRANNDFFWLVKATHFNIVDLACGNLWTLHCTCTTCVVIQSLVKYIFLLECLRGKILIDSQHMRAMSTFLSLNHIRLDYLRVRLRSLLLSFVKIGCWRYQSIWVI